MTEEAGTMHPPQMAADSAAGANGNSADDNPLQPKPELALALPGGRQPRADSSSEESSSSDEEEGEENTGEQFAGPLDAEACTLGGAGARGGEAGAPQRLYVFSRDARGVRIREGGAYVQAWLQPPSRGAASAAGGAADVEKIEATVLDAGDGSYAVEFTAPRRGNFDLHVLINGGDVGGGAFPLFFSASSGKAAPPALLPAPAGAQAATTTTPAAAATTQEQALPPPPPLPPRSILGAAAAASEVPWPSEDGEEEAQELARDLEDRSLLLAGVHAALTEQQLRQLCAFAGEVESAGFVGKVTPQNTYSSIVVAATGTAAAAASAARTHLGGGRFALVRFASASAPRVAAPALDGQTVAGRVVRAEPASATRPVALAVAAARRAAQPGAARDLREAAAAASVVGRLEAARAAAKQAAVRASALSREDGGDRGAGFGRSGDWKDSRRPRSRREEEAAEGAARNVSSSTTATTTNTPSSSNQPSSSIEQSKQAALSRLAALQARLTGGGTGVGKGTGATAAATAAAAPLPPPPPRRENSSPPDKTHHNNQNTNTTNYDDDRAGSGGEDGEAVRSLRRGEDRGGQRRRRSRSRSLSPARQQQRRRRDD